MILGTDGMLPITVMVIIAGTIGAGAGIIITAGDTLVVIITDIITILIIMVAAMFIILLILLTEMAVSVPVDI